MGKIDFNDLIKVIKVSNTLSGTNVITSEIDFELPRGYIAKIKKVIIANEIVAKLITTADEEYSQSALVLDPDDDTTVEIPDNEVQHDVLCDRLLGMSISSVATDTAGIIGEIVREWDFPASLFDVVTARNCRFNSTASGAAMDASIETCEIYYTLEKVTDADFLSLLGIL